MNEKVIPTSVVSVNLSEEPITTKIPVEQIEINDNGTLINDKSCAKNQQFCILPEEEILNFNHDTDQSVKYGFLGEHFTVKGLDFDDLAPFDRIQIGEAIFEITKLATHRDPGDDNMMEYYGSYKLPKGSALVRVVKGGKIRAGMAVEVKPKIFRAWVITLSDRISRGDMQDFHGPKIKNLLSEFFIENNWKSNVELKVMADDCDSLRFILRRAREEGIDLVITLGGTGVGPRDITPDVVSSMMDKIIPGIMEHLRISFGKKDINALLSRGIAGITGNTFVITLPGSVSTLNDYVLELLRILKHLFFMQKGLDLH
ncbi:MAG: molybdopterin-binding protein [Bacteroidales bacterium]